MDAETDVAATEPVFRPVKRRKFVRRRPDHDSDDASGRGGSAEAGEDGNEHGAPGPESHVDSDETAQATGVVRFRRPHPARKGGIAFSTTSRSGAGPGHPTALEPAAEDLENAKIQAMCDRFTAHTGQTVDVDKHMMAYIESEIAKRHRRSPLTKNPEVDRPPGEETAGGPSMPGEPPREPASLGKLHEIDLGQETKLQNIARTEAATRRLTEDEDAPDPGETGTPPTDRSGPDGKPWRHRKRRTSTDLERDRLVEEVLRESKLDVYDEPEDEAHPDDQAADDRIAEQFRRDFLDAIQSRRRVARTRNAKATKTEAPRGPKLGGSRSARAAMREMQGKTGQK